VTLTFIYMMFILKIPILMLFGIVWWAMKSQPDAEGEGDGEGGGGQKVLTEPLRPRGRGPHGEPQPQSPRRVRVGEARPAARRY